LRHYEAGLVSTNNEFFETFCKRLIFMFEL